MLSIIKRIEFVFVKYIYADHNSSFIVKRKLNSLFEIFDQNDASGLNIGAGFKRIHPKITNMDIFSGPQIDIVGFAEDIPSPDESFDLVISQECLEHVKDPFKAMNEIFRVLKKDGKLYLQLPFIIGYHPGPTDFWRYTIEGIEELIRRNEFTLLEKGITVGGGSGYYRISVEFFAILFSLFLPVFYKPFKVVFAVILYPLKAFDFIFKFSSQKNRIPGGFYIIAQK